MMHILVSLLLTFAPQDSTSSDKLLPEVTRILDVNLPGWKWGTTAEFVEHWFKQTHAIPYPKFISGDFNGDGRLDYALKVTVVAAKRSTDVIVAFLASDSTFTYHVLATQPSEPDVYVVLDKKGSRLYDYETSKYFLLPLDGVGVYFFEKAGETFLFSNGAFRPVITSD
jgi:hypothetical protein